MREITKRLQEALGKQIKNTPFEISELVSIPACSDHGVRVRTLEECLKEFEEAEKDSQTAGEALHYLIQVKPKRIASAKLQEPPQASYLDGVYLQDGNLNISYLLRNAEMLLSSKEYALACNVYRAILKSGQRSAVALYGMARCFEAENKLAEAQRHYEESIAYHPTIEAYQRLALILQKEGKNENAAEVLERSLLLKDLKPAAILEIHRKSAECWIKAKKPAEAERHWQQILEGAADPAHSQQALLQLGEVALLRKDVALARTRFQAIHQQNPQDALALAGLGDCAWAEADTRTAHDFYARSLESALQNPRVLNQLIHCAVELRSFATVARLLEQYVERCAPADSGLLLSLAGIQMNLGRATDAQSTLQRILSLEPGNAQAEELLRRLHKTTAPPNR